MTIDDDWGSIGIFETDMYVKISVELATKNDD